MDLVLDGAWRHHLDAVANALSVVSKETETEFLDLGANLQNFSFSCIEIASQGASLVQTIESGDGFNVTLIKELFEKVYGEIEKTAEIMIKGSSGITDVIGRLSEVSEMETFLKKLARTISIIDTLIRIETARVGNSEFNVTTDIADSLARQILKGTVDIVTSVKEANAAVTGIKELREPFLNLFEHELGSAKTRVRHILEEIDKIANQAKWLCERINSRAYKISPELGEVVAAIQFHDITRQQIEHVSEVMHEINEKMSDFDTCDEKGKYTLLRWMHDALKIQISQLHFVLSETEKAAEKIAGSLSQVSELQEAQAEDAAIILDEEQSGKDRLKMMGYILEALLDILTAVNYTTTEMINGIKETTSKLGGMSQQAINIRTISEDMNLLALNAIIKVARTGAAGRSLGVLAEEISNQSKNASEKISAGAKLINDVLLTSANYTDTFTLRLTEQVESSNVISKETKEAIEKLMEGDRKLIEVMSGISNTAKRLESEIKNVVSNITFDKIIKNKLMTAASDIEKVLTEVRYKIPDDIYDHIDYTPDLDDMLHRYTMDSERLIHYGATVQSETEAMLWVDENTALGKDDALGDNVELF